MVIDLVIPGFGHLRLTHLMLDLNGTLTLDGQVPEGVPERLSRLSESLHVELLTADTLGTADELAARLGVSWHRIEQGREAEAKRAYVASSGAERVVAIGNGRNDALMLESAGLGIAMLGKEGTAGATLLAADVVAPSITDALDLLLRPRRLLATLRY